MRVNELTAFIRERHRVYEKKAKGAPKPWTKDPILRAYRFCNVYRELDTVTKWVDAWWRAPHAQDVHLWFAMCVARLVNWPETLEALGYPAPWCGPEFERVLLERQRAGLKVFGGAYIVSTNGRHMSKPVYLARHVLDPLWEARGELAPRVGDTLADFHTRLTYHNGMGSFMAAQVVADIKYVKPLYDAPDWDSWAASGPGSRRGLNRVTGHPTDDPWLEEDWKRVLDHLREDVNKRLLRGRMLPLHAQDLQNCLCEFDKYERVRLGEGRPRATYPGA